MNTVPRLLLLSDEGPQMSTAGGILLYRLFQDYAPERMRVIEREVTPDWTRLSCRYQTVTPRWWRLERSRFNRWHRSLRAFGLVPSVPLQRVDAQLAGFAPEVVVCVMQHASYYDIAWRYARVRNLPLIVIVHDVNEEWEQVLPWARSAQRRRDGAFYRFATRRLCVSPEMEELCAQLYGVRGDVQYPNRSEDLTARPIEESRQLKQPGTLSVGFVGNLNYGYGDELLRLLPAFRAAQARLVLFSKPPGPCCSALLAAKDCVDFRGFVPSAEAWTAVKRDCDTVILAYPNPAGHMERLVRHHFPSKLPEYLALGMPVVITGPDYATGVRWGLRHTEAAATWSNCAVDEFAMLLVRLRDDSGWRLSLAREGVATGDRDFDPGCIKETFLGVLSEAASQRSESSLQTTTQTDSAAI